MQDITFTLTIAQINTVLAALGERPYNQVHETVKAIVDQANTQALANAVASKTE